MKIELFPICGVCKKRILYPIVFSVFYIEREKDGKIMNSYYVHRKCDKK